MRRNSLVRHLLLNNARKSTATIAAAATATRPSCWFVSALLVAGPKVGLSSQSSSLHTGGSARPLASLGIVRQRANSTPLPARIPNHFTDGSRGSSSSSSSSSSRPTADGLGSRDRVAPNAEHNQRWPLARASSHRHRRSCSSCRCLQQSESPFNRLPGSGKQASKSVAPPGDQVPAGPARDEDEETGDENDYAPRVTLFKDVATPGTTSRGLNSASAEDQDCSGGGRAGRSAPAGKSEVPPACEPLGDQTFAPANCRNANSPGLDDSSLRDLAREPGGGGSSRTGGGGGGESSKRLLASSDRYARILWRAARDYQQTDHYDHSLFGLSVQLDKAVAQHQREAMLYNQDDDGGGGGGIMPSDSRTNSNGSRTSSSCSRTNSSGSGRASAPGVPSSPESMGGVITREQLDYGPLLKSNEVQVLYRSPETAGPSSSSLSSSSSSDRHLKEEQAKQVAPSLRQSPIAIMSINPAYELQNKPLIIEYPATVENLRLNNTGFSWEVKIPYQISMTTALYGAHLNQNYRYRLDQFHCHWGESSERGGSEHTVDDRSYSAEMHFVHYNMEKYHNLSRAARHPDGLVVLSVFLDAQPSHHNHAELDKIVSQLRTIQLKGDHAIIRQAVRIENLLPANRSYWSYQGSLTTPPHLESVTWFVLKCPIKCNTSQVEKFKGLSSSVRRDDDEPLFIRSNFRKTQPLNGRTIVTHDESSSAGSSRMGTRNL